MNLNESVLSITQRINQTKSRIQSATTGRKNQILSTLAELLLQHQSKILAANRMDIESARQTGKNQAFIDRLTLNESRITNLVASLNDIRELPDPVGSIENLIPRPSGIMVGRMKVPLGAILMIYEARPNVTIDAAALCIKTGNVAVLRGGTESLRTSLALTEVLHQALRTCGFPPEWIIYLDNPDKELLYRLLKEKESIDVVIPRGGANLIRSIYEHSVIPVIGHFQGICHVYVHAEADPEEDYRSARRIIINAKVQRPGVCNAMECLLVDESIAHNFLPGCAQDLIDHQVKLKLCPTALSILQSVMPADFISPATSSDWDTEFLDLVCAVKVVKGFEEALDFIRHHGSRHSESILTRNLETADRFIREVDASCVLVNASTRFNDGGELGLGAELGISTTKLHAYGPMGLDELCARKFVVIGHGEIRS